ncbi:doubled motif LPXTG anchor domain-containing protein [Clostridium sp. chh4-2]|uniref:doubled motif LPXTG anchor domain-containing protein n=1 Tax=Clostridium sp. chh4-2 TaxID=2067550 RepID=UPI0015E180EE|nr:doubled motif LPXTG anchor domain-containing protein [Clostridium sp. chh4-2]
MKGRKANNKLLNLLLHQRKRIMAFVLAFTMTFINVVNNVSVALAAVESQGEQRILSSDAVIFQLDAAELSELAKTAAVLASGSNALENMEFKGNSDLVAKYHSLFSSGIAEIQPYYDSNSDDVSLRVFVKDNEKVIFLLMNDTEDYYECAVNISGYMTEAVFVDSYSSAVVEEVPEAPKTESNKPAGGSGGSGSGGAGHTAEPGAQPGTDAEVKDGETADEEITEDKGSIDSENRADENQPGIEEDNSDNELSGGAASDDGNSGNDVTDDGEVSDDNSNGNDVTDDGEVSDDSNSGNDVTDDGEASDDSNSGNDVSDDGEVSDDSNGGDDVSDDGEASDDSNSGDDASDDSGSGSDDVSDGSAQASISSKYAPRVTTSIELIDDVNSAEENEDTSDMEENAQIPEIQQADGGENPADDMIISEDEIIDEDDITDEDGSEDSEVSYGIIDSTVYDTVGYNGMGAAAIIVSVKDLDRIEVQKEKIEQTKTYHQVTYEVDQNGAVMINGAGKVEDGQDLTFTVKPQAGYTIESVSANGEELESVGGNKYLVESVGEEVFIDITTSEEVLHPEFTPEPITIGDVVISVYAEENIIPEGTVFVAEAVTAEKQEAIEEKVSEEAEKNSEEVLEVLSYEIDLIYQGEKLTWNEGTVQVSFSGAKIEEKSAEADKVDIAHVEIDHSNEVELDMVASEEVPGEENIEAVDFEAKHFSTYTVTFTKKNAASRELTVFINSFDNYQETELEQKHESLTIADNGSSQAVETFVNDKYTANGKTYEFSKATAENRYEAPKVTEIALDGESLKAVTVSGAAVPLVNNQLYLWYVPVNERIEVTLVKTEDGSEKEETGYIPAGTIAENVPEIAGYEFVNAKVGDGVVTYVTRSGDTVFYGDDTLSGDGLAYALKDNEKIRLYYEKTVTKYKIVYQEKGDDISQNEILGPSAVKAGEKADIMVNLGLGYRAKVTVNNKEIQPAEKLLEGRSYRYEVNNVNEDKNVVVTYEKITQFTFDPTYIAMHNHPTNGNFHNSSYNPSSVANISRGGTLEFYLISDYSQTNWQLNGFQVNGVDVTVPVSYNKGASSLFELKDDKGDVTAKIRIELYEVVKDYVGINKYKYRYFYRITFSDVMSDLAITSGNFRAASWAEIMPGEISKGVTLQYKNKENGNKWTNVQGSKPIGYSSQGTDNKVTFRYEIEPGYRNLQIIVKNGNLTRKDAEKQFVVAKGENVLTTLEVTVDLINYNAKYNANGGSNAPVDSNKYNIVNNATVYIPSGIPVHSDERVGFLGWQLEGDKSGTVYSPNTAVPLADLINKLAKGAETINFTAKWSEPGALAVYVPFKIEFWQQQENGTYIKTESADKSGLLGSKLILQTANYADRFTGYTFNSKMSQVVIDNLQRGQTMKLYYDLNHYTVNYQIIPSEAKDSGCSLSRDSENISILSPSAGSTASDSVSQNTGGSYVFDGWYSDAAGTKLITETKKFVPQELESATYYAKFTKLKANVYDDGIIRTYDNRIDGYEASDKKQGHVNVKVFTDGILHHEDTVYYRYEQYNCVDLTVEELADEIYILNRIYVKQSLGATGSMSQVYDKTNMENLDNVADGSTVYFYLTSKYSVQYRVSDTTPTGLAGAVPNDNTVYTVKTPNNQVTADGYREYTNKELDNAEETIVVKALPEIKAGYSISGWSSLMGDKKADDRVSVKENLQLADTDRTFVFEASVEEQQPVTITYTALNGGKIYKHGDAQLVSTFSEELAPATGIAAGAKAAADKGFTFGGWYKDEACTELVGSEESFVPEKESGSYQAASYYAKFTENPEVTIFYKASKGGTVDREEETTAPATGSVNGSLATAGKGYHFVNWTDSKSNVVSTKTKFTPEKVDGLFVSETYTANFTKNYELTITAEDGGKVYDGTPLTQPDFQVDGLHPGHSLKEGSVRTEGTITEYGTSGTALNKVIGNPVILDENGNDVTYQYDISRKSGKLTITKKQVTISVDNTSKPYGADDPKFSGSVNGLINDADLGKIEYRRIENDKDKQNVGDLIHLTADYAENANYAVKVILGILTITQTGGNSLTVKGSVQDYDGTPHGLETAVAEKTGSTLLYQVGEGEWTEVPPTFINAGKYSVNVKATNPNYKETEVVTGTVTINKLKVDITVSEATKVYNTQDPEFTGTVGTLVSKDDLGIVTYGRIDEDMDKQNVGDNITITAYYTPNDNYQVNVISNKLIITKAEKGNSVNVNGNEVTYDGKAHGLLLAEADAKGSTIWYRTENGTWSTQAPTFTNAGTYPVEVKATNPNYVDTEAATGTIVINPKAVMITVTDKTKEYGARDPIFEGSITGLVADGDLEEIRYVRAEADKEKNNVGDDITITAEFTPNSNYSVTVIDGKLSIGKAQSGNSVIVEGTEAIYDGTEYGLTKAAAEQENSVIYYRVKGTEEWSQTSPVYVNAGTYEIEVKAENPNFMDTKIAVGTIIIKPAEVTITVDNQYKKFNESDPVFTGTVDGLVIGENLENLVYVRKDGDEGKQNAGDDITIVANYQENANYHVTVKEGKLIIDKADGNSVIVEGSTHTYDSNAYGLERAEAVQPGSTVLYREYGKDIWSQTPPAYVNAGTYKVEVKATNPNYKDTEIVTGTVQIDKVNVTIHVDNKTKAYGLPDPDFTGTVGALVSDGDLGEVTYVRKTGDEGKGDAGDDITITAVFKENINYNVTVEPGKLIITKALTGNSVDVSGSVTIYDGLSHGLLKAEAKQSGSTLLYRAGDEEEWSETPPSYVNAGTYPVQVKAVHKNYEDTAIEDAVIQIDKKPVSIIVDSKTKTYGEGDPVFTGKTGELVKDGDLGDITYVRASGDENKNNVNDDITITAYYKQNDNYVVDITLGKLIITAADGNGVNVRGSIQVYDGKEHTLELAEALKPGSTILYQFDGGEWSKQMPVFVNAGSYEVKVKAINQNFAETDVVSGTVVINKAKVEISVDNKTKAFGETDPGFSGTVGKLVSDGDLGTVQFGRIEADKHKQNAGDDITLSAFFTPNDNYDVEVKTGKLTITKAKTGNGVNVENSIQDYDGLSHGLKSVSAEIADSILWYQTGEGDWSTEEPTFVNAGTYEVKVKASNANYEDTKAVTGTVTIKQLDIKLTADSTSKKYGEGDPDFTGRIEGVIIDENDLGKISFGRAVSDEGKENAGDHITITAFYKENANYRVEVVDGTLTITKAESGNLVTVEGSEQVYDGQNHGLTSVTALISGSAIWYRTDGGQWSKEIPSFTDAGTYPVEVKASNPNYMDTEPVTGVIKITPLDVEITVNDKVKLYGENDPAFDGTVGKLVEKDDLGIVTFGRSKEDIGKNNVNDNIRLVAFYTENKNYNVTVIEGKLTIEKATEGNLVFAEGSSQTYDGQRHGLKSVSAQQENSTLWYKTGENDWTTEAPEFVNAGSYEVRVMATNPNYADTAEVTETVVINPLVVAITVDSKSKIFGADDPIFTGTVGKLAAEGDLGSITFERAAEDAAKGNVGDDITLTAKYTPNDNYEVVVNEGKLTITAADGNGVNVEGSAQDYDGKAHGLKSVSALKEDSTIWYKAGTNDWSQTAPMFTNAGTYEVLVKATNPNFKETAEVSSSVIIRQIPAEIVVDNKNKKYGEADPVFTGNVVGLVKGDDLGTVTYARRAEDADKKEAGDHIVITASYEENANYLVTVTEGALTIDKAESGNLVKVEGSTNTYDGNSYGLTKAEAVQANSTILYREKGTDHWSQTAPVYVNAGTYDIEVKATNRNYEDTEVVTGTVIINKAPAQIVVDDKTKIYGEDDPEFTGTVSGLIAKNDLGTVGFHRLAEDAGKNNAGDSIGLTASYEENDNYQVELVPGTLTISKKAVKIVVDDKSKVYGEEDPEFTAEVTGTIGDEEIQYSFRREPGNDAGQYQITAVIGSNSNYEISVEDGMLTIQPKAVQITAVDKSKTYGENDPELTAVVTGLVGDDSLDYTLTRASGDDKGSYPIYIELGVNKNYTVETQEAELIINPKDVTITVNSSSKTYGEADPVFTGMVTGLVDNNHLGTIQYVRTAEDAGKDDAGDSITITAVYMNNDNYVVHVVDGTLTIVSASDNAVNVTGRTVEYDGKSYGLEMAEALRAGSTLYYSTDGVNFTAEVPVFTEAGSYAVYVKASNPNYADTAAVRADVIISKRPITITAGSASKRYDGSAVTNTSAEITSGSLAEGQQLVDVNVTGSQTTVGTSDNVASHAVIMANGEEVTGNYEITYINGLLTITSRGSSSNGGGGGNSGTTPGYGNGGDTGNGPGSTTINPTEVPLASMPNDITTGENILIDDGEVPLAALPKTGNQTGMNGVFAMLSGILLAAYLTISKKKDEES